jgi:mannosylfructose-phosphate synthase
MSATRPDADHDREPRNPRRVLLISLHGYVAAEPELGKPDTGGQVVYILRVAECLGRMGYKVDILTRRFEGQQAIEPIDEDVRVVRIPAGGDGFIAKEWMDEVVPEWVENTARFIARRRIRYSFISSHYWDAGLAGTALAKRLALPHVHTPHSLGAWKRDSMGGNAADHEARYRFQHRVQQERAIYAAAHLVVATTPQQAELLAGDEYAAPAERIAMIPPGYDDTRFFPVSSWTRETTKREVGLEGRIILALGRMARNKGYDLLLRSLPHVFERIGDARLLLAAGSSEPSEGEREQIAGLQALAEELGVRDRVLFHDYISDDALADHYRAADVFALSSRYEPFGMTAVEAMACGTPTVITTEGGLWQMVRWGVDAIYADPFDPPAFGHALATVLTYPRVASQLAMAGSEAARARFTWNGITQQLLAALDSRRVAGVHAGHEQPRERAAAGLGPRAAQSRPSGDQVPGQAVGGSWAASTASWLPIGS